MISKKLKGSLNCKSQFLGFSYLCIFLVIFFRIYEAITLKYLFDPPKLWKSEALGLMQDLLLCIGICAILYPLYRYLFDHKEKNKLYLFEVFLIFFVIAHIGIIEYFFYQMEPLDVFVFGHQTSEMAFSLNTAGLSFNRLFLILIISAFILSIGLYKYKKKKIAIQHFEYLHWAGIIGLIIFFYLDLYGKFPAARNLIKNKSYYFYANILKDRSSRFFEPDIKEWVPRYQSEFAGKKYIDPEFPFLYEFDKTENLSTYLRRFEGPPNIVILLTESLSEYFIHPIRGIQFMPFLDSLSKNALYWPNHFSLGERSFAANPAINAAVPYGDKGFSLMETYPYHFSLINVLNRNNYYTSFYYGQGSWFHNKKHFFLFNNINRIIDKNDFDSDFEKVEVGEEKNFWGYNDIDLFNQYLRASDTLQNRKRLDIVFTGTSHSPFIIKNPEHYNNRFQNDLKNVTNPEDLEHFSLYKKFYLSLYNVDDAYRALFDSLQKRKEYENSIFIITGDHAMTELPRLNAINPYKVPLIIYSPKLKKKEKFEALCSQNDIYNTLLAYLHNNYKIKIPKYCTSLGDKLVFENKFDAKGTFVFMNNNRQIVDIYSDGYYLFNDRFLFKVYENLEIREIIDNDIREKLRNKLYSFRAASKIASKEDKLMPDSIYFTFIKNTVLLSKGLSKTIYNKEQDFILDSCYLCDKSEMWLDVAFTVLTESSSFPELQIQLSDGINPKIILKELKFPYDKSNFQFHEKIKLPTSSQSGSLSIRFVNPGKKKYSFTDLKYVLYCEKDR
ncbi:MAG: LTA synthase family protein [Saprospiraceae bacterium]|nr:LTA synthase family protein [Saprospiraceae bacterium]